MTPILNHNKRWILSKERNLTEVLTDHDLASLGDAYVNFAYSLALSIARRRPVGAKVKGTVLAAAVKKAGLRQYLPSRMTRHSLSDAAESLIVYAWLNSCITLDETIAALANCEDHVEGFGKLLEIIRRKIIFP